MTDTVPTSDEKYPWVQAAYVDPETRAVYVHNNLVERVAPWTSIAAPIDTKEAFGDVESWAQYVQRYMDKTEGDEWPPLLTWSEGGLRAILDYHGAGSYEAGRCKWLAVCDFVKSTEWAEWSALCNNTPRSQQQTVEALEGLVDDIEDPAGADILGLLRSLRASYSASASTELRPDGTSSVSFTKATEVRTGRMNPDERLELPATLVVAIPVFKGDTDRYKVTVRMRARVDEQGHLGFRFVMERAERIVELVAKGRADAAKAILGEDVLLLRAV